MRIIIVIDSMIFFSTITSCKNKNKILNGDWELKEFTHHESNILEDSFFDSIFKPALN